MSADFDTALNDHFAAIANRDIEAFKRHLTTGKSLFTIVQNGHAFKTPEETIAIHEEWFKDPHWSWEASVVHQVVGADLAMADQISLPSQRRHRTLRDLVGVCVPVAKRGVAYRP
jgi:CRISPR/Cas system CSM-associated protein Csm5 (group 7 of RAMP superfamily)